MLRGIEGLIQFENSRRAGTGFAVLDEFTPLAPGELWLVTGTRLARRPFLATIAGAGAGSGATVVYLAQAEVSWRVIQRVVSVCTRTPLHTFVQPRTGDEARRARIDHAFRRIKLIVVGPDKYNDGAGSRWDMPAIDVLVIDDALLGTPDLAQWLGIQTELDGARGLPGALSRLASVLGACVVVGENWLNDDEMHLWKTYVHRSLQLDWPWTDGPGSEAYVTLRRSSRPAALMALLAWDHRTDALTELRADGTPRPAADAWKGNVFEEFRDGVFT